FYTWCWRYISQCSTSTTGNYGARYLPDSSLGCWRLRDRILQYYSWVLFTDGPYTDIGWIRSGRSWQLLSGSFPALRFIYGITLPLPEICCSPSPCGRIPKKGSDSMATIRLHWEVNIL